MDAHPLADQALARSGLTRLAADCAAFAEDENVKTLPRLATLNDAEVAAWCGGLRDDDGGDLAHVQRLIATLESLRDDTAQSLERTITTVTRLAATPDQTSSALGPVAFVLLQQSGAEARCDSQPFSLPCPQPSQERSALARLLRELTSRNPTA